MLRSQCSQHLPNSLELCRKSPVLLCLEFPVHREPYLCLRLGTSINKRERKRTHTEAHNSSHPSIERHTNITPDSSLLPPPSSVQGFTPYRTARGEEGAH
ncbi:hypothetical protein GDO81_004021 [Engystomops pustulosus]|uniref:Uncharacterized protein n=1 Tax=Engystomops pustulosus TaxID=76066 RepID=A0AAV6ZPI4_ENGPU|nr:hypothetical protein GDO81_004021 [Engystomops pustulosus]